MAKVIGFIIDFLMPPLRTNEIIFAMVSASILRGIMVAVIAMAAVAVFIPLDFHNIALIIFYIFFSSLFLALLGLITGVFADSFDHVAAITSYIITPLSFLSGTFYSINNLPEFWRELAHYNPFFHMIDGFRYSMTGYSDGNIHSGMLTLIGLDAALWVVAYLLISKGYRLKQ
jgi:ABC-2 type transport system permease protein